MTKVKICGITNLEDVLLCERFGADEIGLNFYPQSKRYVSPEEAKELVKGLNSSIRRIGVFVNPTIDDIVFARKLAGLDAVQLHGDETPEFVSKIRTEMDTEIIKAVRVRSTDDIAGLGEFNADAILLDTFSANVIGGTGETFDWDIARRASQLVKKIYLAGGLNAANVRAAIQKVKPYAVDVASGVESSPRKKDATKLEAFIRNAKSA